MSFRGRMRRRHGMCGPHTHGHCCRLEHLGPGTRAVIETLTCQGGSKRKLLSLGMIPGKEVTCLRGAGGSGLCVRVGTSEFFINSDMARQIQVRYVS